MDWLIWCAVAGSAGVVRQAVDHVRLRTELGVRPETAGESLVMIAGFAWRFVVWAAGGFVVWLIFA